MDTLDKQILSVLSKHYMIIIYGQIVLFTSDFVHLGQKLYNEIGLHHPPTSHPPPQTFGPLRGNIGSSNPIFKLIST